MPTERTSTGVSTLVGSFQLAAAAKPSILSALDLLVSPRTLQSGIEQTVARSRNSLFGGSRTVNRTAEPDPVEPRSRWRNPIGERWVPGYRVKNVFPWTHSKVGKLSGLSSVLHPYAPEIPAERTRVSSEERKDRQQTVFGREPASR